MEKITKKKATQETVEVEKDVTVYKTTDGYEYADEKDAEDHEELLKKCPKLDKKDIEWIENFRTEKWGEIEVDDLDEAFKSDQVILLLDYDGCNPEFDTVIPDLIAVTAAIKALHNKSVGMNCDRSVRGIIYKGESLCCDQIGTTRGIRNIKEVLK
jgi:hypothetical protein